MNELNISSYIQIMQTGLKTHDKQESAGVFLPDAINKQDYVAEQGYWTSNLSSKKISRLVSRDDPVPDGLRQASMVLKVIDDTVAYFKKEVMPDLNPHLKDDTLDKFAKLIGVDATIPDSKEKSLMAFHEIRDEARFLAEVFLYALNRPNKKPRDTIKYQDVPLLAEANYECPLCHRKLVDTVKGQAVWKYRITQIFPDSLDDDIRTEFSKIYPAPKRIDTPDNLIALDEECSDNYLLNPSAKEYKRLREIKIQIAKNYEAKLAVNSVQLEDDIRIVLDALSSIRDAAELVQLEYDALRIDEKFEPENFILKNVTQAQVVKSTQEYNHVRSAKNGKEKEANETRIAELEHQERDLIDSSSHGLLDLDSMTAQRLSELNEALINYRRQRARIRTQLNSVRRDMNGQKRSFKRTFTDLERFFPNEEFRTLEDIERFHQKLTKILEQEFAETEKNLANTCALLGNEIVAIQEQIMEVKNVPNVSQAILQEFAQITTELNNLRQANANFDELQRLKQIAADYAEARDAVIADELLVIESTVNQQMRDISLAILEDTSHMPPILRLERLNKYTFNTPNDGGTGAQYRGLITFDLANMAVTHVPFVVHDSVLLKNIERPVFAKIIEVYHQQERRGKQVFMAYDTLDAYDRETRKLIEANTVLELSPGGNELFGWAWNKERQDEAGQE